MYAHIQYMDCLHLVLIVTYNLYIYIFFSDFFILHVHYIIWTVITRCDTFLYYCYITDSYITPFSVTYSLCLMAVKKCKQYTLCIWGVYSTVLNY